MLRKITLGFIALIVISAFMRPGTNPVIDAVSAQPAKAATPAAKPAAPLGWQDSNSVDSFTGEDNSIRFLKSQNTQNVSVLGRPTSAQLVIWKKLEADDYPMAIVFSGRAQPRARTSYGSCFDDECYALVKLDGGQVERVVVYEGSSSDAVSRVFIKDRAFVARLQKAKKIEIRLRFYREGNGDFVFNAS